MFPFGAERSVDGHDSSQVLLPHLEWLVFFVAGREDEPGVDVVEFVGTGQIHFAAKSKDVGEAGAVDAPLAVSEVSLLDLGLDEW